ncbi:beta-hexosaminidase-like isoform X2 [Montipora foliosa]
MDQSCLDNIADSLDLKFDVLSNMASGCLIRLTFTNRGRYDIKSGKWTIYFSSLRKFNQRTDYMYSTRLNPKDELEITHINGYLHSMKLTNDFSDLLPNKDYKFYVSAQGAIVSKTDVMPNWYITARGLEPRVIQSTKGESLNFVGPFNTPAKWKRSPADRYDPLTPEKRFEINNIADLGRAGNLITPTPLDLKVVHPSKTVKLSSGTWSIVAGRSLDDEARYLGAELNIQLIQREQKPKEFIELRIGNVRLENSSTQEDEAYKLRVHPEKKFIRIVGNTPRGVFWGIQSLLSIVDNREVPWVSVDDIPRYEYRGLSIDVARNFLPKPEVMRIIDGMAMFKMNKLHLHMADDEGWRLEIPGLKELTEIASNRCHDLQERKCLEPQLGSGPFNNTSGSGHYTVKDYKEILKHARERHVDIIPEFDMPGHSHAAIKAMENRYRKYLDEGQTEDGRRFYLNDPKDESQYESGQFFFNNSVNPCVETSYQFVEKLVSEVRAIHSEIQPLKVIHLGGDEVPDGAWSYSPACERLSMKINENLDWKAFFVKRVAKIAGKYGINLALWEDGLMQNTQDPIMRKQMTNDRIYGYAWGNTMNLGYRLANAGYKVVMTQASHLYFDHPYEPDPEERGIYWATRCTDTRKAFGFMPENMYKSLETEGNGVATSYCETVGGCVPPEKLDNIVGMAGAIWSETIRTPTHFQFMTFPRLLAVSERAWHSGDWENQRKKSLRDRLKEESWERFANTLGYKELRRLDKLGINYRIPLPGARLVDGVLKTNVAFPGLTVECSIDGGKTWFDPKVATVVSGTLLLRTRSADSSRTSRVVKTKLSRNNNQKTYPNYSYSSLV